MKKTLAPWARGYMTLRANTVIRLAMDVVCALLLLTLCQHFDPGGQSLVFAATLGSTATLDGLLKDYYDDEWVSEGVNNKNPLKDIIDEKAMDKKYGGRRVVYGMHTQRNKSPFASAEYGLFAEADIQTVVDVSVEARKLMARTFLTPEVIMDSADSDMAWEDAEENNFDRLVDDVARRNELMLSYDGRGVTCRIQDTTPSGSADMTVDSPAGVTGSTFGNRFAQVGAYYAAINPATGGIRAGISKLSSNSADGTTMTFTAAPNAAWTNRDYIVKAANASVTDPLDTEYENWFWGLLGLFDDGTYRANFGGIDRTLIDNANTYVNASTGVLSMDTLQLLADTLDIRSGGTTSLILGHYSIRRLYIKLTQADRRYAGQDLKSPDAGTVAFKQGDMTIGEVPFKVIRDFPYGMMLGLDVEKVKLRCYVSTKGEWVKDDKGAMLRPVGVGATARDAWEAWYRQRKQYWAKFPAAAWRADGIIGATVSITRPLGD